MKLAALRLILPKRGVFAFLDNPQADRKPDNPKLRTQSDMRATNGEADFADEVTHTIPNDIHEVSYTPERAVKPDFLTTLARSLWRQG